jgi:hypothetical protein
MDDLFLLSGTLLFGRVRLSSMIHPFDTLSVCDSSYNEQPFNLMMYSLLLASLGSLARTLHHLGRTGKVNQREARFIE